MPGQGGSLYGPDGCGGFSLLELVMVMTVMAILAAVAVPRLTDRQTVDGPGFADETRGALQFGRSLAIAQRRKVCISADGSGFSLTRAAQPGQGVACTLSVVDPSGGGVLRLTVPGGLALTASRSSFAFDGQGRPVDSGSGALLASAVTLAVAGSDFSRTVTIENETGYVH